MTKRAITKIIQGQRAMDGAGVSLVRVLGYHDAKDFDPFLMLDSFDSVNPSDYTAGFPMHPHRGIETITYLITGSIEHEDSLGNKGYIHSGESQWMTAGSGILHQEMPKEADRMLGIQLWLNLPKGEKMTEPKYLSITPDMMGQINQENAKIRVLSGSFGKSRGVTPPHIPATIYDILLKKGTELELQTKTDETVFIFLIEGDAVIGQQLISSKSAVLFGQGDNIRVTAPPDADSRFLFFSAKPLQEPIAWGGPIVMNTQDELNRAFQELNQGTFIKYR